MGAKTSAICDHRYLTVTEVKGLDFQDQDMNRVTSYKPFFAHLTCPRCHLDFYGVKYHPDSTWRFWTPKSEDQKSVVIKRENTSLKIM
jgi:hypothetical protein